jgi:hypothetical protein
MHELCTMAHTGYFQSYEGQFGCLSCDSLGDFYQELEAQTSCQFCPSNTQRYIGFLSGANRSACQCKEGAIVAATTRWLALRASVSTGPPTAGYHNARLEAGEVRSSRHRSLPCAASYENTARLRVCRSVRNVRERKGLRRLRRRRPHALSLPCVESAMCFASRSSRRFMSWPVEPSLSGSG